MTKYVIVEGAKGAGKSTYIENSIKRERKLNGSNFTYVVLKRNMWIPISEVLPKIVNHTLTIDQLIYFFDIIETNYTGNEEPDVIYFDRLYLSLFFTNNHMHSGYDLYRHDVIRFRDLMSMVLQTLSIPDDRLVILGTDLTVDDLLSRINGRDERRLNSEEERTLGESINFYRKIKNIVESYESGDLLGISDTIDWNKVSEGRALPVEYIRDITHYDNTDDSHRKIVIFNMTINDWQIMNKRGLITHTGNRNVVRVGTEYQTAEFIRANLMDIFELMEGLL